MGDLPVNTFIQSIVTLLSEVYAGPSNPRESWIIDHEPEASIFGALAGVSAQEASQPVEARQAGSHQGGSSQAGSTIASNVEHLRWSLANVNATMRGAEYNPNWKESWALVGAGEQAWNELRQGLRSEFERLVEILPKQSELPGPYLNGVLALIPHAAFHLGVIRQMIERVRPA